MKLFILHFKKKMPGEKMEYTSQAYVLDNQNFNISGQYPSKLLI
jgi:hypothetical protein